jgi:predicted TIM-barrel fold metal-dependent hydrolase
MRINAHCHVFNLQSVFTQGTRNILENRLERSLGKFAFVLQPLLDLLERAMADPDGGINLKSSKGDRARRVIDILDKDRDPKEAVLRARLVDALQVMDSHGQAAVAALCGEIRNTLGVSLFDASLVDIADIVEFVSVALASSMDDVTDYLFDQMAEGQGQGQVDRGELVIAPLMMDILSRDWNAAGAPATADKELRVFAVQAESTLRQCLRHPGRVLPFYAVNPWRPDWLRLFKDAMNEGGFIGMKVYPSLGYRVDQIAEALVHCAEQGIPVMTHCNDGGFKAAEAYAAYCRPREWRAVIEKHGIKGLRLCFGHFGGDEAFRLGTTHADWAGEIIEMMQLPDLSVYADVSFHTSGMDLFHARKYFRWLQGLLDSAIGDQASRVLFGTDYFLVLQQISEESYWDVFVEHLEGRSFERMARKNAAAFLGLDPDQPHRSTPNIRRHLDWLGRHQADPLWGSGGKPANWLANAQGL